MGKKKQKDVVINGLITRLHQIAKVQLVSSVKQCANMSFEALWFLFLYSSFLDEKVTTMPAIKEISFNYVCPCCGW